jgi:hypothetical protein
MSGEVISARLHRRIQRDFPGVRLAERVENGLGALVSDLVVSRQNTERLLAAAVFSAAGDFNRFRDVLHLGREDWRDLLVAGGLEHEDWPGILDEELGPR